MRLFLKRFLWIPEKPKAERSLMGQSAAHKVIVLLCLEGNRNWSKFGGQNVKSLLLGNIFTDTQQDKRAVAFHKMADQS